MTRPSLQLVPDGVTIDRWGEFVSDPLEKLLPLFSSDQEGYLDAIQQLVQTIAVGGEIIASKKSGKTEEGVGLREMLNDNDRLVYAQLFTENRLERADRLDRAHSLLDNYWQQICDELDNSESAAGSAFLGFMCREFLYYRRYKLGTWGSDQYSKSENVRMLSPTIKARILRETVALAARYQTPEASTVNLDEWIDVVATTHYRTFLEYFFFVGSDTGYGYMPALTRSSLAFIWKVPEATVTTIALPFVALNAIEKVKKRKDLIPRVIDWAETRRGREVSDGLRELKNIELSTRDPHQKAQLRGSVEGVLSSTFPRYIQIAADLLRFRSAAVKGEADLAALSDMVRLKGKSYRWLWAVRSRDARTQWREKIRELSESPE